MLRPGILLINLGSPTACTPRAVAAYLRVFLGDPRVVDVPVLLRWALLYGVILPFRTWKTWRAYQTIWAPGRPAPLVEHSQAIASGLEAALGIPVALGMRYGEPSIASALDRLYRDSGCRRLWIVPLFPQYATAAGGSVLAQVHALLATRYRDPPETVIVRDFGSDPGYLQAQAEHYRPFLAQDPPDHILFSYHGIPVRQLHKSGCDRLGQACDAAVCSEVERQRDTCYRAQCFYDTAQLAGYLGLATGAYSVSFQSRLGRIPWIPPYTDQRLKDLRAQGVSRLAVAAPSFVADCLETLEELQIRLQESWRALGGTACVVWPCMNGGAASVAALCSRLQAAGYPTELAPRSC